MIYYNTLPSKFKNWNDLWSYVRHRIQPDYKELKWSEFGNAGVYEFSIDYMKAKCFDEFIDFYSKMEKPDPYEFIHPISADYFLNKIDKFLQIK